VIFLSLLSQSQVLNFCGVLRLTRIVRFLFAGGVLLRAFAFVDIGHPVVAWGAYRGVLVSANAEYLPPHCPISMMFAGIVLNNNHVRLHNELLIEKHRQIYFPHCNSRLTGMYFFEQLTTAENAYTWGGHFSAEYLAEFEISPSSSFSRHDANWITHAPLERNGKIKNEDWISKYWSGEAFPNKPPVWELIIQGRAVILGTELRNRAYMNISKNYPESVSILEVSRIAAHIGSDLGHVSAWGVRNEEGYINLAFYLDMRDADNPEFLKRVGSYDGPRNYKDIAVGGDFFRVPDFREFSCEFLVSESVSDEFLFSVHRNA